MRAVDQFLHIPFATFGAFDNERADTGSDLKVVLAVGQFQNNAYALDCMHRKKINISTVLAGQRLGIKEVDEGIWLVSFLQYDLGYIDLEQKTLQPLDNPFGPGVSPMS